MATARPSATAPPRRSSVSGRCGSSGADPRFYPEPVPNVRNLTDESRSGPDTAAVQQGRPAGEGFPWSTHHEILFTGDA